VSAFITISTSLTKCQTITFITNSSDELPWLPTYFTCSHNRGTRACTWDALYVEASSEDGTQMLWRFSSGSRDGGQAW
jgi:hypothetical protein